MDIFNLNRLIYCFLVWFLIFGMITPADASNRLKEGYFENYPISTLEVNPKEGARLFHSGILIAPSVGGRFEIFKTRTNGGRERILRGPVLNTTYGGHYRDVNSVYTIEGKDQNSQS
jgi:hypothetical protein